MDLVTIEHLQEMAPGVADGYVTSDITWPERSMSWHHYAWGRLSRKRLEIRAPFWLHMTLNVKVIQIYLDGNILKSVRDSIGQTRCSGASKVQWCITVSTARLLRTWPTAALLSQTLHHGVICVLPVVVNYSSLDTISPHMVVRLFLSRVWLPGTACATNCENRC